MCFEKKLYCKTRLRLKDRLYLELTLDKNNHVVITCTLFSIVELGLRD